MSSFREERLPDFENPPVIEVVIGAQFAPIIGLLPTHSGLFWQLISDEYPKIEVAPTLSTSIENLDGPSSGSPQIEFDFTSIPPLPRLFFIDASEAWLIQLQADRILQNWRKTSPEVQYPRFPAVLERFEKSLETYGAFCCSQGLAQPRVSQMEVTYINQIPRGEGWSQPKDIGGVFPDFAWRTEGRYLPDPEAVAWKMKFLMPERLGRLHVSLRHAIKTSGDQAPVLLCELTARGKPLNETPDSIRHWIESARELIVRGFTDLVSPEIQLNQWGRKG